MKTFTIFTLSLVVLCLVAAFCLASGELLIIAGVLVLCWSFIQWRALK